jgi:hypothetical protein
MPQLAESLVPIKCQWRVRVVQSRFHVLTPRFFLAIEPKSQNRPACLCEWIKRLVTRPSG